MFRNTRHIHLVAIGGVGMSGIAEILLNLGFRVSGSDLHETATTRRLSELGARVFVGHGADRVTGADVVVYSSAVTDANPEIRAARNRRIPVIRRADMLAELMRLKYGVAIAGSHGKTTTTSMVAAVLGEGGIDPTVIVGGKVLATGTNAQLGKGEYLVAEADESDGTFLRLSPTIAVVTNIDLEHVDFYPDLDHLREAFSAFLARVPFYGTAVLCHDDAEVRALAARLDRKVLTYGLTTEAQVRAEVTAQRTVVHAFGEELGTIELPVRGSHNLRNALAAVAVGLELGVDFASIARGLSGFRGVGRRCENRGVHGDVLVLDDYGHHPTEIQATMEVARSFDRRVAVLFQPHRYSRTRRFQREFADSLAGADTVALLPVYAASEVDPGDVTSDLIADGLREKDAGVVTVLASPRDVPAWLDDQVQSGDLLLTLGAGDIGRLVDTITSHLDERATP